MQDTIQDTIRLFSVTEAARRLSISERRVWQLIERGELRACRVGRRRLVWMSDLLDYINRCAGAEKLPSNS